MSFGDNEYFGVRRVVYGEGATFVPVCEKCGRFVKPYKIIRFHFEGPPVGNTAHCSKCGRTEMLFEGYIG